jgi:hypothetical protein
MFGRFEMIYLLEVEPENPNGSFEPPARMPSSTEGLTHEFPRDREVVF